MTDSEMFQSLSNAAREHRRIREEGLADDRNWVMSQPAELELWADGARKIVAVRGDIFMDGIAEVLALFSLRDKYADPRGISIAHKFVQNNCTAGESLPPCFLRRKDNLRLVYYKQIEDSIRINGKIARGIYEVMMDAVSRIGVGVVSVLGMATWGHSEFDCFDAIRKWLRCHRDSSVKEVRLVDLNGMYHELSPSFVRLRPKYNPYDNTENFPIWKAMGRSFI